MNPRRLKFQDLDPGDMAHLLTYYEYRILLWALEANEPDRAMLENFQMNHLPSRRSLAKLMEWRLLDVVKRVPTKASPGLVAFKTTARGTELATKFKRSEVLPHILVLE